MDKVIDLIFSFFLVQLGALLTVMYVALLKYVLGTLELALLIAGATVLFNLLMLLGYKFVGKR